MAWHVILCSIANIDAPNKGIEQACSGRVVIYIPVHLVPIHTLTLSNVLLVLALNLIVHKSSYCKCSLAWCQARTFLLFTTWTHPLQMREYPLQYASTDKNKKIPLYNGLICISKLAQEHPCSIPLFGTSMQPIEHKMTCQAMWKFWLVSCYWKSYEIYID